MNSLLNGLEKFLLPIAEKLNNQRHLGALRDGFIAVMPLMIIGAFGVMLNNVFFAFGEGSLLQTVFGFDPIADTDLPGVVQFIKNVLVASANATLSIVALAVSFSIAYSFTEGRGLKGLEAGIISVAAFFTSLAIVDWTVSYGFFGGANIITAIIIALITGEIYCALIKRDIRIKMPEGVPPAVERSFSALIPATVVVLLFAIIQVAVVTWNPGEEEVTSFSQFIQLFVAAPLSGIVGGAGGLYVYAFLTNVFWFFGIHGPNTLAFLDQGFFTPAAINNADLINQGIISANEILDPTAYKAYVDGGGAEATMYTKTLLDAFAFIGGSGATLGLVIALFIGSKVDAHKKMAKYAVGPALFNINEPLLFGLPIVFNPVLFIPFIIMQPLLLTVAILAIKIGLVPMYSIPIPWTSPVGLGAFLGYGGSITAAIVAVVCVVIATVIYLPFVIVMNRVEGEKGSEA